MAVLTQRVSIYRPEPRTARAAQKVSPFIQPPVPVAKAPTPGISGVKAAQRTFWDDKVTAYFILKSVGKFGETWKLS